MIARYDFATLSWADRYRYLSDAFTIPGLLYLMIYALIWASSLGALDGIGYLLKNTVAALIPGMRAKKPASYFEYMEKRKEKRKPINRFRFLLLVGGICLIVAIVFIFLFYQVYQ